MSWNGPTISIVIAGVSAFAALISACFTGLIYCVAKSWKQQFTAERGYEERRECLAALSTFGDYLEATRQYYFTLPTNLTVLAHSDPEGKQRQRLIEDSQRQLLRLRELWDRFHTRAQMVMLICPGFSEHAEEIKIHYWKIEGAMSKLGGGFMAKKELKEGDTILPDPTPPVKRATEELRNMIRRFFE